MWVTTSSSSIRSNCGRSNTGRRSSSNWKIDQRGQASTPAVAAGVMAAVNAPAAATAAAATRR